MSDVTKSPLYLMYLAANNNPEFYTIDHVMQWAACALREANARADAAVAQNDIDFAQRVAELGMLETKLIQETARADELQGRYDQCCKNYKELVELWKAETARADAAELKLEKLRDRGPRVTSPLSTPEQAAYNEGFNDCRKSILEQTP